MMDDMYAILDEFGFRIYALALLIVWHPDPKSLVNEVFDCFYAHVVY